MTDEDDDRWCLYCTRMADLAWCGGFSRRGCQYIDRWDKGPANAPVVWGPFESEEEAS